MCIFILNFTAETKQKWVNMHALLLITALLYLLDIGPSVEFILVRIIILIKSCLRLYWRSVQSKSGLEHYCYVLIS